MELKGNGGHHNTYTEINIANVENVNPNVKEVNNSIHVGTIISDVDVNKSMEIEDNEGLTTQVILSLKPTKDSNYFLTNSAKISQTEFDNLCRIAAEINEKAGYTCVDILRRTL